MTSRTYYLIASVLFVLAAIASFIAGNITIGIGFSVLVIVFGLLASRSK